ncbi:hypothetical protein VTK73DRAFT_5892 [Phialemonium thermophilum]|uniref:MAPEG family protein n=1 Tax=Phialemonium thermophilum TaxID=223376 RepID=A0ABR3XXW4_9PEZI
MASLLDLSKNNLSYYTVPAVMVVTYLPHFYASVRAGRNYSLAYPRSTPERLAKAADLDKQTIRRIQRAEAATANGLETLGLYAAGVVAGNVSGMGIRKLNVLTLGYLAVRIIYNYLYVIAQDNSRRAPLRSLSWLVGLGIISSLFVWAGHWPAREVMAKETGLPCIDMSR